MSAMTPTPEDRDPSMEAGMLDYSVRNAIRDLIDRYGFEHARQMIAFYLLDEAERPVRRKAQ